MFSDNWRGQEGPTPQLSGPVQVGHKYNKTCQWIMSFQLSSVRTNFMTRLRECIEQGARTVEQVLNIIIGRTVRNNSEYICIYEKWSHKVCKDKYKFRMICFQKLHSHKSNDDQIQLIEETAQLEILQSETSFPICSRKLRSWYRCIGTGKNSVLNRERKDHFNDTTKIRLFKLTIIYFFH